MFCRVINDKDPEYPFLAEFIHAQGQDEDWKTTLVTLGRFKTFAEAQTWIIKTTEILNENPEKIFDSDWLDANIPPDTFAQIEALLAHMAHKPV